MQWFWRLFFWGRIRRMKRIQAAAARLSQGRTEEAENLLKSARPRHWVEDLAIYHFVLGRLKMEKGELNQAEAHLHTATCLGLDRPSVKLNLAVLRVRKSQLSEAMGLLDDVETSNDETILEQARVMRQLITQVRDGTLFAEIEQRARRFEKNHLKKRSKDTPESLATTLLQKKLSSKEQEDASLFLGQLLIQQHRGAWQLGLEARDHRILVSGLSHSPYEMIEDLLQGRRDRLSLEMV